MRSLGLLLALAAISGAQPAWKLSPKPLVEIGDESRPETQFNRIRSVVRMPGGEIVVANAGTQELRVFSPTGTYVKRLSRSGKGPGEFEMLGQLFRNGDTIYAVEPTLGAPSLQVYTLDKFIRKHSLRAPEVGRGGAAPVGRFRDGQLAVNEGMRVIPEVPPGQMLDDSATKAVLVIGEPNRVAIVGRYVDQQLVTFPSPMVQGIGAGWPYPFGRSTAVAVAGDRFWIGDSRSGNVTLFDEAGRKVGSFQVPIPTRPLDPAAVRRRFAAPLGPNPSPFLEAAMQAIRKASLPGTAPHFWDFVAGVDGEVWVRRFFEDANAPQSFVVVNPAGKAIGALTLPPGVRLHEVGRDYITAVRTNDDGVEQVVVYGLTRAR